MNKKIDITDEALLKHLIQLKKEGRRKEFFDELFLITSEYPEVVTDGSNVESKLRTISEMNSYFLQDDVKEYEKCAILHPILTRLTELKELHLSLDRQ